MPEPSLDDIALLDRLDVSRRAAGLLTVRGILETVAHDNAVLDPFSLLVATGVRIGRDNVFHPSVELITCQATPGIDPLATRRTDPLG